MVTWICDACKAELHSPDNDDHAADKAFNHMVTKHRGDYTLTFTRKEMQPA